MANEIVRGDARRARRLAASWVAVALLAGCTSGFRGGVLERLADGSIGPPIPDAAIRFVKEDGSATAQTVSDAGGRYQLSLAIGRYVVTATHPAYEDYSSAPGFFVVTGNGFQTGNVFLRAPAVTTVLVVRHADRDDGLDALLVPQGTDRAARLAEVGAKAGVTAIYSTNTVRTRATAQPLADALGLPVQIYSPPSEVAGSIASDHPGDVVLVVGHSDTTTALAEAIVGQDLYPGSANPLTDDFDQLFIVARVVGAAPGSVVDLQYGADTAPDTLDLSRAQTTNVLLLRHAETAGSGLSPAGQARAAELVHAARNAGVSALFAPPASVAAATVAPLAAAIGRSVTAYDPADLPALVNEIFSAHAGQTVLVAGDNPTLRGLVRELGAQPVPPIFDAEFDHLMIVLAPAPRTGRLLSLQYGADSP